MGQDEPKSWSGYGKSEVKYSGKKKILCTEAAVQEMVQAQARFHAPNPRQRQNFHAKINGEGWVS